MIPQHHDPLTHYPSLYIHIPWCVRKCPYCDFNSHGIKRADQASPSAAIPEAAYVAQLLKDFEQMRHLLEAPLPLQSIFFGGGTPSLFSPKAIGQIIEGIHRYSVFTPDIEITLETNPGTVEHHHFLDYRAAGVNRISLGAQSFQDDKLKQLGRIHSSAELHQAIRKVIAAGFENINLDIMYGLPHQQIEEAIDDVRTALSFDLPHFSWYHLALEPNTPFYRQPPILPHEDTIIAMQQAGIALILQKGFEHYEVSAFAKPEHRCRHNLNYWQYGDYIGIGAGAHGKITDNVSKKIHRHQKIAHPKQYMEADNKMVKQQEVVGDDRVFEFMLNALRLTEGFEKNWFLERTFMTLEDPRVQPKISAAIQKGLLKETKTRLAPTALGRQFLNSLLLEFLDC